jgi:hypothetical protein
MKTVIQALIFMAFTAICHSSKSQDTIKLPAPVANRIAKDLVSFDSAKAILVVTKEELELTREKLVYKDSIISNWVQKGNFYEERIKNEKLKFDTQGLFLSDLQQEKRKLSNRLAFTKISASAIIGVLLYLYITK